MPSGPHSAPAARPAWAADLAVGALACIAFVVALRGELVLDDLAFLAANPALEAVGNPLVFFRTRVWDFSNVPGANVPLYRPVFMLAVWAGRAVLGGPLAWHLAAVALHAACAVLVARLARGLLPGAPAIAPFAAGLVFAVHPVHAEAVAWILAFVHPLATLLALVAALSALRHARGGSAPPLVAAAVLAALSALTAEGALAVPPILVALDATARRRLDLRVAFAQALALAAVLALRWSVPGMTVPLSAGAESLHTAADFLGGYLRQLILPWPQPLYLSLPAGGVAGPLSWAIAVAATAAAAWAVLRSPPGERPVALLAAGWLALALAPVVAGALNARPLFAPRALYLPSVGVALLVAWLLRRLPVAATRPAWAALAAAAAVGVGTSNAAARGWITNEVVYARAAAADPAAAELRVQLGRLAAARGDPAAAEASYRAAVAVAVAPTDRATSLEALGEHLAGAGRLAEAEAALRDAAAAMPARSSSRVGLGNVAFLRGDLAAAREHYAVALELDPRNFEAASNLAAACDAAGDTACARRALARAQALRPVAGGSR